MAGKSVAASGTNYLNTAKLAAMEPQDHSHWLQLQQQAKGVTDAMKRLITAMK